ncbi:S-Ena type endospore appendage [Bacillus sinesaloumensis]|uniref:S-Ena type endospore appendage n=1 Tax=Litchfieldia sinesaloumensis TaxID=1926280 RepID=UPI0009887410|nr:S-Ena type endospore appendage [Bacillus sinesaloumensis]
MSGSNKSFCCPESKVLTEEICGVLDGPIDQVVWTAPSPSDYFQGTFTVTNTGPTSFIFSVNGVVYTVPPGNTVSVSVNNPANFIVTLVEGDTGKYCITLYKRFFV